MRIALLSFYSGHLNRGAETWTHEFANKLSGRGNELTVFQGGKYKKDADYRVVELLFPVNWVKGHVGNVLFLDYWSILVAQFSLKTLPFLWREKFDIVIPVNGGWQTFLVRLITWLRGSKMVVVGHSGVGGRDEIWNAWNMPDAYVGLSSRAKEWAKRINPFIRVSYIPNGVDLQKFKPQGKKLKTGLKKPVILYVGALDLWKRPLETIRAVAQIKNASLLVVGDGGLREEAKNLGEKLLGQRFSLKTFSYNKMSAVYRVADVFTSPSSSGYSFEIVLIEAMATNLPIVANDDPVRREILGNAGIFVDPTNTKVYTKALNEVLRRDFGNRPRVQAEKFSWGKISRQYEDLFKKLIK